jgi:hypothetical protein
MRIPGEKQPPSPLSPSEEKGSVGVEKDLPARRQRFQNTVNPASSGTISPARSSGAVSPLIREPSPRSGSREAIAIPAESHPPVPSPLKGRGDGGEGWRDPCQPLVNASRTP